MTVTYFNQWRQWLHSDTFNWTDFDIVTISFTRDKLARDWGADIALLGLGVHLHFITKKGEEYWNDMVEGIREIEELKGGEQ